LSALKENLLVQFTIISFGVVAIFAVVLFATLSSRLSRNVELVKEHGASMMSGQMIMPSAPHSIPSLIGDINETRLMIVGIIFIGLLFLYFSLVGLILNQLRGFRRAKIRAFYGHKLTKTKIS